MTLKCYPLVVGAGYDAGAMHDPVDPWSLQAALDGDAEAWARLVDEFGDTIWHWARSQGLGREDAEDVAQTVWYLLKDKGRSIEDPRRLPGWLATTTRRYAQTVSKRRIRDSPEAAGDMAERGLPEVDAGPADSVVASDLQRRLREGYDTLRPRCRELLSLLWSDVPYAEVAETLGMAIGSIGETRRRCLDELRRVANVGG